MDSAILPPIFALILWTIVIFLWIFALHMSAMNAANINPESIKHTGILKGVIPSRVEAAADNYDLMEQPTIF